MRFLRSLTTRLFLSHILVAVLTSIIVTSGILIVIWSAARTLDVDDYRYAALTYVSAWQFDFPESEIPVPEGEGLNMAGFTLIVDQEDRVEWRRGETSCQVGMTLTDCAPEFAGRDPMGRMFERDGERWAEVVMRLANDRRIILQRGPSGAEPFLSIGDLFVYGYRDMLLFEVLTHAGLGIPVALVLAALIARPQLRRLSAISSASRRFAEGLLNARVDDHHADEVGELAQQFDDMADTLEQNIGALRDLAHRNGELAQQAEQLAIQAERNRISRDLHDAIAQRLFSLSMSTTTLPDIIANDREKGIEQAKMIAKLAEQTQLDLRALLLELRPTIVMEKGLAEALRTLVSDWQSFNPIGVDCSFILNGKRVPAVVQDAVYRITEEALSNISKHARATSVQISLVGGQRQLILSISDNGMGFEPDGAKATGHFGLTSMRERALSVGGELVIESDETHGTTVQATLPLASEEKADAD
jgi:two-component system, NarL family, sensor histidine kinase LiaS